MFCYHKLNLIFIAIPEHVDDIITLIFQYLNLLRKEGPLEWVFKECQVSLLRLYFQISNNANIMIFNLVS